VEHEAESAKPEGETERLEEHSDEVGERIEGARREWEAKEQDSSVPGAQADEDKREESDQLPEEGPSEQVADDEGGDARDEAQDSPGVPGEDETATGNPDAAGTEESDED
jgi:hypothetical protein